MFGKLFEDLSNIFGKTEIVKQETEANEKVSGEGFTEEQVKEMSMGITNAYSRYVYSQIKQERDKIKTYRDMAMYPEIGDVIEEICDEGTKEDETGKIISLEFRNTEKFKESGMARKNLLKAFDELFYKQVSIQTKLWEFFYSFMVDGRLYLENIIDKDQPKRGIIGLKKLPARSMDFDYDAYSGKIVKYYQTIRIGRKKEKVDFNVGQISYMDYGLYGKTRKQIYGYLEKAKIPYRQLKLLEDSAVIYRIVRAPERFVFKVDTGNMPRHKSEEFMNKMKRQYKRQMTYNPSTGSVNQSANVLSMLENFWIPTNSEGRGSEVDVLSGGANLGEIDDILYFLKKLYKALKYPAARVIGEGAGAWLHEGRASSEISRDEVKFAKFIERIQIRFANLLERLFLLHLSFKTNFIDYNLTGEDFSIRFTTPSSYKEVKELEMEDLRSGVYSTVRSDETISATWAKKKYLKWTDEDIEENKKQLKKDAKDQEIGGEERPEQGAFGVRQSPFGREQRPEKPSKPEITEPKKEKPEEKPEEKVEK